MINHILLDDDRVVGLEFDGEITQEDIDRTWAIVEEKLTRHERLRVYVEFRDFGGIDFTTWLKSMPKKFQHLHSFEREAIVSDKLWLERFTRISDRIFTSVAVRHFHFDQMALAKAWITES